MTALEIFCENVLCEKEASDQQRSILLVDIMNVLGFSKSQREIHIHAIHLHNVLMNILRSHDNWTRTMTGIVAEVMCGGIYANVKHKDYDYLYTNREIKLCTPRTNYISNPSLLHDNEDYKASSFC